MSKDKTQRVVLEDEEHEPCSVMSSVQMCSVLAQDHVCFFCL